LLLFWRIGCRVIGWDRRKSKEARMAYDDGMAELMRGALDDTPGISERKMFGGLCFMLNGNMLCGVHAGGGMFRVGKENEAAALAVDGAREMDFTRRRMPGFVEATDALLADDDRRGILIRLALNHVGQMPAK